MDAQGRAGRAVAQACPVKSHERFRLHVTADDAEGPSAVAVAFIANLAVAIAALGMALHQLTGAAIYDAVGSILIGAVMAVAALMLISRNGRFLAGKAIAPEHRHRLVDAIRANPEVVRVTFVYAEFIGPERLFLMAGVGIRGEHDQAELAAILRAVERRTMQHKYIGPAILTLTTSDDAALP